MTLTYPIAEHDPCNMPEPEQRWPTAVHLRLTELLHTIDEPRGWRANDEQITDHRGTVWRSYPLLWDNRIWRVASVLRSCGLRAQVHQHYSPWGNQYPIIEFWKENP